MMNQALALPGGKGAPDVDVRTSEGHFEDEGD